MDRAAGEELLHYLHTTTIARKNLNCRLCPANHLEMFWLDEKQILTSTALQAMHAGVNCRCGNEVSAFGKLVGLPPPLQLFIHVQGTWWYRDFCARPRFLFNESKIFRERDWNAFQGSA